MSRIIWEHDPGPDPEYAMFLSYDENNKLNKYWDEWAYDYCTGHIIYKMQEDYKTIHYDLYKTGIEDESKSFDFTDIIYNNDGYITSMKWFERNINHKVEMEYDGTRMVSLIMVNKQSDYESRYSFALTYEDDVIKSISGNFEVIRPCRENDRILLTFNSNGMHENRYLQYDCIPLGFVFGTADYDDGGEGTELLIGLATAGMLGTYSSMLPTSGIIETWYDEYEKDTFVISNAFNDNGSLKFSHTEHKGPEYDFDSLFGVLHFNYYEN